MEYKYVFDAPCSLHDARVRALERADGDLWLRLETGYFKLSRPVRQEDGDVCVKQVNWDFSVAWVLSPRGRHGRFQGEKMELSRFVSRYGGCPLEILDESFGYDQVQYTGYLSLPDRLAEVTLSICHRGPIVYERRETVP